MKNILQGILERGYITTEELRKLGYIPPDDRLKKGPVAIIECPQEIPCNICVGACPFKAIEMENITALPKINWDKCIGCTLCVAVCPGLAIFVVDLSRNDGKAHVTIPHEFLPKINIGDEVYLLNRKGERVGIGRAIRVYERNKTQVVTIEVPRELALEVKAIWKKE